MWKSRKKRKGAQKIPWEIKCPKCGLNRGLHRDGKVEGKQRYKCWLCGKRFSSGNGVPKKYDEEILEDVRDLYALGVPKAQIARRFDVHYTTITRWLEL